MLNILHLVGELHCLYCVGAGGPEPPKLLLPTTDYLYNMTGRNISRWLVKTTMDYLKKRSHGILCLCTLCMSTLSTLCLSYVHCTC